MTRPFFSKDRISHFDNFDRHADDALGQLKARLREGHPVDFQVCINLSFLLAFVPTCLGFNLPVHARLRN
jgi:hypothetical protein